MTNGYNELIWHFAGYIHIINEIATSRYEYGPALKPSLDLALSGIPLNSGADHDDLDGGRLQGISNIPDINQSHRFDLPISDPIPSFLFDNPNSPDIINGVFEVIPPALDVDIPSDNIPSTFTISFLYRITGPQHYTYKIFSHNNLTDNDLLVSEHIDAEAFTGLSVEELIGQSLDAMPSDGFIASLEALANEQISSFLRFDNENIEEMTVQLANVLATRALANAEMRSEAKGDNQEIEEAIQSDEMPHAMLASEESDGNESVNSVEDGDENQFEMSDGDGLPEGDGMPANTTGDEDAPEPDQMIHLGSNEAVNAASIVDTSEAGTSFVILGDYFENNAVVQTNIYSFNDNTHVGPMASGQGTAATLTIANTVTNEADIARETGEALVPAPIGFSLPGYNFSVDYVMGDFFDLNIITQVNNLTDNDTTIFESRTNEYLIGAGDNSLVNATQILDLYQQYDMIFINGSYYEINLIQQTNIVLDVDNVTFSGFGNGVNYDNNILENDATIRNFGGGELFKPLTDDVEELITSISNYEDELTYTNSDIDFGMAVNTPFEVSVLYVTGDFYQLNAIFQTNILSDIDAGLIVNGDASHSGLTQNVQAANNEPAGDPVYATGENLASNQASIIDYDSQSAFQYLGGDFYEHDILIQVDLIAPEDEAMMMANLDNSGDFVNEVIVFTGEEYPNDAPQAEPLFIPAQDAGESGEVMGSMMA